MPVHKNTDSAQHVSSNELWRSVLRALENERCLDLRYRANSTSLLDEERVPNYKVMKQLALRNQLGLFYRPLVFIGLAMIPAVAVIDWICAVLTSLSPLVRRSANLHILATIPVNVGLIESALSTESDYRAQIVDHDLLVRRRLSADIGLWRVAICIASHFKLLLHIFRFCEGRRIDLFFHSRDAMVLLMLACYASSKPDHRFATEDHYQRWAYLLSHHSPNLLIVQHGALDGAIPFAYPFGSIRTLYLREQDGARDFDNYYTVGEKKLFIATRNFKKNEFSNFGVFIASSFPYIDSEIELARMVKSTCNVSIIVKFHPAHHYDQRRAVLEALTDHICADDEYPTCQVFVSQNSFMENDYRAGGIPVFSMERQGGPTATANAISNHFASIRLALA